MGVKRLKVINQGLHVDNNCPWTKLGYDSCPTLLIFYWRYKGSQDKTLILFKLNLPIQSATSSTSETRQSERAEKASGALVKPSVP